MPLASIALDLRQNKVGIRANTHAAPSLIVVVVLAFHQLQSFVGITVVERHRVVVRHIDGVAKAFVELYQSDNAIVDEGNELRTDSLVHERLFLDFQGTDALSLDEQLIGKRLRAQDAPRGTVIMELLLEQAAAFANDLLELSVCFCFVVSHNRVQNYAFLLK